MLDRFACARNCHGVELAIVKLVEHPDLVAIGIYRSPRLVISSLLAAIRVALEEDHFSQVIVIGDFNVNWLNEVERRSLYNLMVNENALSQLISSCTTDNGTLIDHIYTNLLEEDVLTGTTSQ